MNRGGDDIRRYTRLNTLMSVYGYSKGFIEGFTETLGNIIKASNLHNKQIDDAIKGMNLLYGSNPILVAAAYNRLKIEAMNDSNDQ